MKESAVEKKLERGLRLIGYRTYKFVSPGNSGVPDRIVVGHGRTIFVELKTDVGRLSQIQIRQIQELARLGQEVCVIYGSEGVTKFLKILEDDMERIVNAVYRA